MARPKKVLLEARPGNSGYDPEQVKRIVNAIEALDEQKKDIAAEIAELKKTAKETYSIPPKALAEVLRGRKMGKIAFDQLTDQVERLRHCLGDFGTSELGKAAIDAASNGPHPTT